MWLDFLHDLQNDKNVLWAFCPKSFSWKQLLHALPGWFIFKAKKSFFVQIETFHKIKFNCHSSYFESDASWWWLHLQVTSQWPNAIFSTTTYSNFNSCKNNVIFYDLWQHCSNLFKIKNRELWNCKLEYGIHLV